MSALRLVLAFWLSFWTAPSAHAAYTPANPLLFDVALTSGGGTATVENTSGHNTVSFYLDLPGSATGAFTCSFDGGEHFVACSMRGVDTDTYGSTVTADGSFTGSVAGATHFRVTATGGSGSGSIDGTMVPEVSTLEGIENPAPLTTALVLALNDSTVKSDRKFGGNSDVDTAAAETCAQQGGTYTHSTAAATWYASSASAGDTFQYTVVGLGPDYVEQTATVTLTGTTPVALSGTWLAVNRAYNSSTSDQAGTVYLATSNAATAGVPDTASTIRASIRAAAQQTEQAVYTVPAGYTACLTQIQVMARTGTVDAYLKVRAAAGGSAIFRYRHELLVPAGGSVNRGFDAYMCFDEKSAMEIYVATDSNNTRVSCNFDLQLVPN